MCDFKKIGRNDYNFFKEFFTKREAEYEWEKNNKNKYELSIEDFEKILEQDEVFVILLSETPIGLIKLLDCGETVFIIDIYIQPENRQQGFGRKLVEHIEEILTENGVKKVAFITDESDLADLFCTKIGYTPSGENNLHTKFLTSNTER